MESLSESEVMDAWGELVNMVGGHLNALVPPVSRLGLPTVIGLPDYPSADHQSAPMNEITFAGRGERVRLTLQHRQP